MSSNWLKALVLASVCYLMSASLGAALSIVIHLPARFGGLLHSDDVLRDFLLINGTALSPNLTLLLVQVVLTGYAVRAGRAGMVGVLGLVVLGVIYALGQVGEPITGQALAPTAVNLAQALVAANILFPVLMILLGVLEWRRRQTASREARIRTEVSRTPEMPRVGGQS
jgi:hypothetical protein